jgi:TolA-binding protein
MRLPLITGFALAGAVLLTPLLSQPVRAQMESREYLLLRNQIDELRHELQGVQDQVGRGGGSSLGRSGYPPPQQFQPGGNDMVAQLLTRVEALEDQVRQLRGRIDETQNQLQRQGADLGKRIDDLAFQVNPQAAPGGAPPAGPGPGGPLDQGPGLSPPPGPLAVAKPGAPAAPLHRTPEMAMQDGNAALLRHDYAAAEQAAQEVLANRTSPRAYDAQLLLARALYGEHKYPPAAIAFDDAYSRSKKGTHAQDALLGLANALASIPEKKAACDTVQRLRTEFPQPRADVSEGTAAVSQRAGCH